MSYRPALDGIRGIAILLVLACHFFASPRVPGAFGVDVFFVLSGYLITTLLVDERQSRGRVRLGRFYGRRLARLYPAILVMLAVVTPLALLSPVVAAVGLHVWHNAALAATYTGNYAAAGPGNLEPFRHMWSLAVEEQFYVVWPIVMIGLLRFGRRAAGLAALGLCLASWEWLVVGYDPYRMGTWGYHIEVRGGGLLLGCALALFGPVAIRHVGRIGTAVLAATLAVGVATNGARFDLAIIAATLATAAMIVDPPRFLSTRPLTGLGRLSYSLYLWHYPVISLTRGWALPLRVLMLGLACGAAVASYKLVERPVRQWAYARISRPRRLVRTVPATA